MNLLTATGRLTKEPEIRRSTSGTVVARYTIAVDRRYKKDGAPEADFIKCVSFGKTAEFIEKYIGKGRKILVEGEFQNNNYEKDGKTIYDYQILVNSVEFCDSKKAESDSPADDDFARIPDSLEDELPFV